MSRPLLVDLFCCAGGASKGYHDAGFDVVGVDIQPQPNYPYEFIQGDAVEYANDLAFMSQFAAAHGSPPCQSFSIAKRFNGSAAPDLVDATRAAFRRAGLPYIIENTPQAPLVNPLTLCGTMFGLAALDVDGHLLQLQRHRIFESNIALMAPGPCRHDPDVFTASVYGYGGGKPARVQVQPHEIEGLHSAARRNQDADGNRLGDKARDQRGYPASVHGVLGLAAHGTDRGGRMRLYTGIGEPRFDCKFTKVTHRPELGACWEWTAARSKGGYGFYSERTSASGIATFKQRYAHRYAWEKLNGPVPSGLELDHLCRVRQCVNPSHLEPVTRSENQKRSVGPVLLAERNRARGQQRTQCKRGHEFTPGNTFRDPSGHRGCRTCQRASVRRYRAKRKAA